MEHTLPPVRTTPWRTATLVACAVAVLEGVLVLALGAALLAEPVSRTVTEKAEQQVFAPVVQKPKPKPAAKGDAAAPTLTRAETSVVVLNGNGRRGAAAAAAERVRAKGYAIGGVGNAGSREHVHTIVMYRGKHEPEARRLARDLGVKVVGPLDGLKASDLMGAHVALVLGDRA